jgi:hypothetical protein
LLETPHLDVRHSHPKSPSGSASWAVVHKILEEP